MSGNSGAGAPNILIHDEDDFLKFDENEKRDEDSLPLSNSLAFGDKSANLSNILDQSNPFSKRAANQEVDRPSKDNDMFKPQDKLFLNDMSNIMKVEE